MLANLRDKDNLSTADKTLAPNVSVVWRFHCMCMAIGASSIIMILNNNPHYTNLSLIDFVLYKTSSIIIISSRYNK